MKFQYLILFLFLNLILNSCHKEKTEEEVFKKELPGNYGWISSTSTENNGNSNQPIVTYTPDISGNNYSLKIHKSGKTFLYQNGKQIKKGEVKNIVAKQEGDPYFATTKYFMVTIEFGNELLEFSSLSNGQYSLTNSKWPYGDYDNHFKSISK